MAPQPVLAGIACCCVLFMVAEVAHGRFWTNDFEVYHRAGRRIIQGESVYQPALDGFYRFLYTPTAAVYFAPLGLLPFSAAQIAYWLILTGVIVSNAFLCLTLVCPEFRSESPARVNRLLSIGALVVSVHVQRELHLGQVNQILLLQFLLTAVWFDRLPAGAALSWAASLFLKPVGLIVLPYVVIRRRWSMLAWFAGFAAALSLLPLAFYGPVAYGQMLQGFVTEVGVEFGEKRDLLRPGNHMVYSVLLRYSPLGAGSLSPRAMWGVASVVVAGLAALVLLLVVRGRGVARPHVLDVAVLLVCIPLLAYTSHNAFGFVQLAVFLLVFNWPRLTRFERLSTIAGCLLTGMNWFDLWGRRLWNSFEDASLVSAGALALLAALASVRLRGRG